MHLLVFYEVDSKVEFRCMSWRPNDPTRRLRRLADELLPQLTWPDNEHDTEAWKKTWRQPFTLRPGEVITSAARLADRMAHTARDLRDQISGALADENGTGPFSRLMSEIREQLVADVNEERFSDMCAQTLVYGLLSSRVTDPDGFGATPVLLIVPINNPFLSAFFEQVHGETTGMGLEGSGLDQLIADLRETNVEAILDDFGLTAKGGDPVIHFYEEFLAKYDPRERLDAGAFYTPQAAVEFMIRATDEVLRSRFHLDMGIADNSSWQQVADRNGFDMPVDIDPEDQFVSMVDPATGTGTYLVEWLRRAQQSYNDFSDGADWPAHLRKHVLGSMHAFELMLAPYAIAHLKVALELHNAGIGDGAMPILLTDTLDHAARQVQLSSVRDQSPKRANEPLLSSSRSVSPSSSVTRPITASREP